MVYTFGYQKSKRFLIPEYRLKKYYCLIFTVLRLIIASMLPYQCLSWTMRETAKYNFSSSADQLDFISEGNVTTRFLGI